MTSHDAAAAAARRGYDDDTHPPAGRAEPTIRLCAACGVHLGLWQPEDPRCPACRNTTRGQGA